MNKNKIIHILLNIAIQSYAKGDKYFNKDNTIADDIWFITDRITEEIVSIIGVDKHDNMYNYFLQYYQGKINRYKLLSLLEGEMNTYE